ncbi:hypothetical protein RJ640_027217 [Escallonia rubra]|uniref:TPX2 central domain-containing protein n=1 Tax=Escallonia rubra TaxID=112253 RepID=A0AA88UPY0_9ASTE|nr:hypothetical protein RJ640_027217 [Escallonia rubra]
MDEEMEDMMTFTVVEIDLDYEFEAARYFDFSREESPAEAREAEVWFDTAVSCPPSPFVKKLLLGENTQLGNVNTSPKSNGLESMTLPVIDSDTGFGHEHSTMDVSNRGLSFYNHMMNDNLKAKTKSNMKPSSSRPSTLMKPTASQLAKQNRPRQVIDSRSEKSENNEKSSNNSSGIESQAAKRQKLEGGQLRKVAMNQQINLVHKAPKKDGTLDGICSHAKLGLTIPREPDLETAHRAQRMRPKSSRERQPVTSTARPFRALPLNRKILEAPSLLLPKRSTPRLPEFQEFHLKTLERAMQHTSAASSATVQTNNIKVLRKPSSVSVAECSNRESSRPKAVDTPKQEGCEAMHKFRALPLNKKEFNFHTEKKVRHDPPVELFNKGSKENRLGSFQEGSEHYWPEMYIVQYDINLRFVIVEDGCEKVVLFLVHTRSPYYASVSYDLFITVPRNRAMKKQVLDKPSNSPYIVSQAMLAADGAAINMEYTGCSSLGSASLVGNL